MISNTQKCVSTEGLAVQGEITVNDSSVPFSFVLQGDQLPSVTAESLCLCHSRE